MSHPADSPRFVPPGPEHVEPLARLIPETERRAEVACVALAQDVSLLACSLTETVVVELVGGERFALYATVPERLEPILADALLSATYGSLDEAFDPDDGEGPIGICLLVADRDEMKRRPEAFWGDPPMHYVGFLGDGRLVRVAYFTDAALRGPA